MQSHNKLAQIKQSVERKTGQAQRFIAAGNYGPALELAQQALAEWRKAGVPKNEEGEFILLLGKCLVGQNRLQEAYDLYIESMPQLKGNAYDDIYRHFLWLNERMGTFSKKMEPEQADTDSAPSYPSWYYDDFNK